MRLIDIDHHFKINEVFYTADIEMPLHRVKIVLENEPTVEAIPIDWITKWAEKFYKVINGKRYYMGDGYDTIWDLLEDWERENQYGKN